MIIFEVILLCALTIVLDSFAMKHITMLPYLPLVLSYVILLYDIFLRFNDR
jgi:hypothetical protein